MEFLIDHETKDVVEMLLEKTGSRFMLKQLKNDPDNIDVCIRFLKIKSNLFKRFHDEINFWL